MTLLISEKIFKLLEKKDMSQKEFSEQTGISQSTISDWKRKKTNPSADKILKICEILQVTPYELLAECDDVTDFDESYGYRMALNDDEGIILDNFRRLQANQKLRLMGYMEALLDNNKK